MSSLDLDDAESLRRAYVAEGHSLSAIAAMAECSYASVRRALLAHGIEIRRSGPAPIEDLRNRAWLQSRAREGLSAKDIAELLGCAEGTVRSALQWAGVAAAPARARPSALDDTAFLQRAYVAEGRSVRSIAGEIGCTKDAVLAALRTHGVPIRSRGRSTRPALHTAAEVLDLPGAQEDAAVEDREPSVPVGGETGSERPLEPQPEPNSLLMFLEDTYAKVRGESSPEPERVPANEPMPEREPDVDKEPKPQFEPHPASPPEAVPVEFELKLPPVDPERSTSAGATLASFQDPSSESVPEPPSASGPAQHDTGAPVMTITPSAATHGEPPPPSAGTAASPPVRTLPARIDLEIDKIETKTFSVSRRGYDRQEVDAFLRSVARDYRQVVKSAKDAVNAARTAAAQPAPAPPAPNPPAPAPKPAAYAFEDIGGRVTAVLTSAAEAADGIRASAEREALAIRQRAREETERLRHEAAEALAEAERVRVATEQEAAEAESTARAEADLIIASAGQRAAQLEEEAKERITTTDRTVRANIDAAIAEARRDYEHLRSAQQQCIDRLASVEFLAKHARDGLSENVGQSIDELL